MTPVDAFAIAAGLLFLSVARPTGMAWLRVVAAVTFLVCACVWARTLALRSETSAITRCIEARAH